MKLFRWGGLIAFVLFSGLMIAIGMLFIDGWAKKGIEAAGYQVNGAQVDVGKANLTLSPLGFVFENVDVADAENPMRNAISFGELKLSINFQQLFLGNVRLNDVVVSDIETDTERNSPARIKTKTASDQSESNTSETQTSAATKIAQQFPEPESLVDQHTSNTQGAVNAAETSVKASKQKVSESVRALPGDDDLAAYKKRIADIKAIKFDSIDNAKKAQGLLKSLSTDLANDKLAIEAVKTNVKKAVSDAKTSVSNIAGAPGEDWNALKEAYPLSKESAVKVAQLLLGESFFERIDQAKGWYEKAKPWLARLKSDEASDEPERMTGQFVRFAHPNPTASFQMDRALLSFDSDGWPWELTVEDLSTHTGSFFIPTKLNLRRGEAGSEALLIAGLLDQQDNVSVDTFDIKGKGIAFSAQSIELAGSQITWQPERANVEGVIVSTDGELSGKVSLVFPKNAFQASGAGKTTSFLQKALADIQTFSIDVNVSGSVKRPKFSVSSDLDNRLSDGLADVARAEYDAWLESVKDQLDAEVKKLRAPVDEALASLESTQDDVNKRIEQFEKEVVAEVRSLEEKAESERKRLEDKAKAELEAAQKKLEEEKRKAEEAAKKEAEKKLKEEADKLKDQFKF